MENRAPLKETGSKAKYPVRQGTSYDSESTGKTAYDTSNKYMGRAIIFNQEAFDSEKERKGSTKDARDLEKVFIEFGFEVDVHTNLYIQEIKDILTEESSDDHHENDCFVLVMLSHGNEFGEVYARDGPIPVDELHWPFHADTCVSLRGKPKLFFIQACKGTLRDPGAVLTQDANSFASNSNDPTTYLIPKTADILIMFSSAQGFFSFRNEVEGSWFIQSLVQVLRKYSHLELMHILTAVNRSVAYEYKSKNEKPELKNLKQMPTILSMLTKTFNFTIK